MKKNAIALVISLSCVSCSAPTHLYSGKQKDKTELGLYQRCGKAGFFSSSLAYTLKIDDTDYSKTNTALWGEIFLTPGMHSMTLSFINYDWKVIPLTQFDQKYFEGEYVVNFNVKPNHKYMPMFNLARAGQADFFDQMCIAEVEASKGWGELQKASAIVGCAQASIPVVPESFGCPVYLRGTSSCPKTSKAN